MTKFVLIIFLGIMAT